MAKVVQKNANFSPKINDYKLENQISPEKLVKNEKQKQNSEAKLVIEKK